MQFVQGGSATLDIWIYEYEGGPLKDPDGYPATEPKANVYDPFGTLTYSGLATRLAQGHYEYTFGIPLTAEVSPGWRIVWDFTINGGTLPVEQRTEYFEVLSAGATHVVDLLSDLRIRLKDTHPDYRKRRWTDTELNVFIENALWDINSTPPATTYFTLETWYSNIPDWKTIIIEGAMIFALIAQGVLEIAKEFSYSDNGIAVTIDRSAKYQSLSQMMLTMYDKRKQLLKNAYFMRVRRPHVIVSGELDRKLRTMSPSQWRIR